MSRLSEEEKALADKLGLTYTEMDLALKTRVEPETYAQHKRQRLAQRAEWEAKMQALWPARKEDQSD